MILPMRNVYWKTTFSEFKSNRAPRSRRCCINEYDKESSWPLEGGGTVTRLTSLPERLFAAYVATIWTKTDLNANGHFDMDNGFKK